ncbi:hypothetical protein [Corynebacterium matruchotii]|uniref:Uncharacterized protein n=2 Tax=Corynebacterium matruchotii TaxID=43768 RepID=E0DHA1_9CORY|nr:hypothetical protein [Corynebacterium matruchotii]EFM48268.1 hypothetical protein HMPREF0299_5053 [Corynebacterium matruchotii ATCC 14266]KAB1925068.1 hypothetical protein F8196_06315 [Corynebacterium matruchotii]QIP45262.1 hypothetical protein HBA49_06845 [Corynebacterium matruchotii]SPW24515.1 Uncharacterised protein [Corynebacterium matruchotii]
MKLAKTLQYVGYALLPVAILLAIISGEYIFAFVLFFFLVMSVLSSRILPTKIPEGEIPDPAVIKQYRIDHPGTSIQDAMTALMTKPENKA